eukprot:SAG31_NODE_43_length_31224_cov_10.112578_14_plen_4863_part_00
MTFGGNSTVSADRAIVLVAAFTTVPESDIRIDSYTQTLTGQITWENVEQGYFDPDVVINGISGSVRRLQFQSGIARAYGVSSDSVSFLNFRRVLHASANTGLHVSPHRRLQLDQSFLFRVVASSDLLRYQTATFTADLVAHITNAGTSINVGVGDIVYEAQHYETNIQYSILANLTVEEALVFSQALEDESVWSSQMNLTIFSTVHIGHEGESITTTELSSLCTIAINGLSNLCCGGSDCVESDSYPTSCTDACAIVWRPLYLYCADWIASFGPSAVVFNEQCGSSAAAALAADDALCYAGYVSTSSMTPGSARCINAETLTTYSSCADFFSSDPQRENANYLLRYCDGEYEADDNGADGADQADIGTLCVLATHAMQSTCCEVGSNNCITDRTFAPVCSEPCSSLWIPIFNLCSDRRPDGNRAEPGDQTMFGSGGHLFSGRCEAVQVTVLDTDANTLCTTASLATHLCDFVTELVEPGGVCTTNPAFHAAMRDRCFIGCTDEAAFNYSPAAIHDDGTCVFDACASNPCLYDGICSEDDGDMFQCSCTPGHLGTRCEYRIPRYAYSPACSISGPGTYGGRVGRRTSFHIHVVDQFNEALYGGDDDFAVTITSSDGASVPASIIRDSADESSFLVEYVLPYAVEYTVSVTTTWGEHITGSPATIIGIETAVQPHVPHSRASGAGLYYAVAGAEAEFAIELKDLYGQRVQGSILLFDVSIDSSIQSIDARVDQVGIGLYSAVYNPTTATVYTISVSWNGIQFPSSPFTLQVVSGVPVASATEVVGGLVAKAGAQCSFKIISRDAHGNINREGAAQYISWLSGFSRVPVTISALQNGTFIGTYTPELPGQHLLHVYLETTSIEASPFFVEVDFPDPVAVRSTASMPITAIAGTVFAARIDARDRHGHPALESTSQFTITSIGPSNQLFEANNTAANATYFNFTAAGIHSIAILLGSQPLAGSPYLVTVVSGAPILESTVIGPYRKTFSVDDQQVIMLTTRDEFGNLVRAGESDYGPILVDVTANNHSAITARVCMNEDAHLPHVCISASTNGSYALSLRVRTVGQLTISLRTNQEHQRWNLTTLTTVPGMPNFAASVAGSREVVAGTTFSIELVLRDRYSNPIAVDECLLGRAVSATNNTMSDNLTNVSNNTGHSFANLTDRINETNQTSRSNETNQTSRSNETNQTSMMMIDNMTNSAACYSIDATTRTVDHLLDSYLYVNTTVTRNERSGFNAHCIPTTRGMHSMEFSINGQPFGGWLLNVYAAQATAHTSELTGSGTRVGVVGAPNRIAVTLRDRYGNLNPSTSHNITASVQKHDGSGMIATVNASRPGCTDRAAINFADQATTDDGGCMYTSRARFSCPISGYLDQNNIELNVSGCDLTNGCGSFPYYPNTEADECAELCLNTVGCRSFDHSTSRMRCYLGNGVSGIDGIIVGSSTYMYYQIVTGASVTDHACRYGCIDPTATNYDPLAEADSGNCTAGALGCVDPQALNWNVSANVDDGSCYYTQLAFFSCPVDGALAGNNIQINGMMYIHAEDASSCAQACNEHAACQSIDYQALANRCYLNHGVAEVNGRITSAESSQYYEKSTSGVVACRYGCTNQDAYNYDPQAVEDDGGCVNPPAASVILLDQGTYEVIYRVEEAANYSVSVRLGHDLIGSLLVEQVPSASAVSTQNCMVHSLPDVGYSIAGMWSSFSIEFRDEFGVLVTNATNLGPLDVVIWGQLIDPCEDVASFPGSTLTCQNVVDQSYCFDVLSVWTQDAGHSGMTVADWCPETCNRCYGVLQEGVVYDVQGAYDGTAGTIYDIQYILNRTGDFQVQVYLGESVVGAFGRKVVADEMYPSAFAINGSADGVAGDIVTVAVQPRDFFGNLISVPLHFDAQITMEMYVAAYTYLDTVIAIPTIQTENGLFVGTYNVTKSGEYFIQLRFQFEDAWSAPIRVIVQPAARIDLIYADNIEIEAGQLAPMRLNSQDRFENAVRLDYWDVAPLLLLSGPANASFEQRVVEAENEIMFNANITGEYRLNCSMLLTPDVFAVALIHVVPAPPDPRLSEVHGLQQLARVGFEFAAQLVTRDRHGNRATYAGLAVDAFLTAPYLQTEIVDNNDGTYLISFIGRIAGVYSFTVRFNFQHVGDGPFMLRLAAGAIHAPLCSIVGANQADAGENIALGVQLRDSFDNTIRSIANRITFTFTSHAGTIATGPLRYENATSLWTATFSAPNAADHTFQVWNGNDPIFRDPFHVNIRPGPAAVNESQLSIPPEKSLTVEAGEEIVVDMLSRDIFGNRLHTGGLDVSVMAVPGLQHMVMDQNSGAYRVILSFTLASELHITVMVSQYPLYPIDVIVVPGSPSASHCVVHEEAVFYLVAGEVHSTMIEARDDFNNTVLDTSANFQMEFVSEQLFPQIRHNATSLNFVSAGFYQFSYYLETSGLYDVAVTLPGNDGLPYHIHGSPLRASVRADDITYPESCTASGSGIVGGLVGQNTSFVVVARDAFGNRQESIQHELQVSVEDMSTQMDAVAHLAVIVSDGGDFLVTYMVTQPGTYEIHLHIDNVQIAGSPFTVVMSGTSGAVDPTKCTVPLPAHAVAGVAGAFTVETRDADRVPVLASGRVLNEALCAAAIDDRIGAHCLNLTNFTAAVHDVTALDLYTLLSCTLGGIRSHQNFSLLQSLTSACAMEYNAAGVSFNLSSTVSNDGRDISLPVSYLGNGIFEVAYWLQTSGISNATVRIHADGEIIEASASPVMLNVHPSTPSVNHSIVYDPGNSTAARAGDAHSLTVLVQDRFGNRVIDSVYSPEASVVLHAADGSSLNVPRAGLGVLGHNDGSYVVSFVHTVAGVYVLSIKVMGRHVNGSPYVLPITPALVSPLHTSFSGLGLSESVAGQPASFVVHARDMFGNNITTGGSSGSFESRIYLVGDALRDDLAVEIRDEMNGRYSMSYQIERTGNYRLDIFLNGVLFSQHQVTCTAGNLSTDALTLVPSVQRPTAGTLIYFTVGLFDDYGNTIEAEDYANRFSISTNPFSSFKGENASSTENFVVIEHMIVHSGIYVFSLLFDSAMVSGAEVQLTFAPAAAPIAVAAAVLADGSGLQIRFDVATDRGSLPGNSDCHSYFRSSTVALFGAHPKCTWQSDTILIVELGYDNYIFPYTRLLLDSVIARKDVDSLHCSATLRVLQPDEHQPLSLISAHPSMLGACSDMIIDCTSSLNAAPGPGNFTYAVDMTSPNALAINNYLSGLTSNYVTIPRHLFEVGHHYIVRIEMTNRYLEFAHSSVTFSATELPLLRVLIPHRQVDHRDKLVLSPEIEVFNCTSFARIERLSYQWELVAGLLLRQPDKWTDRRLILPAQSLEAAAVYTMKLSVFSLPNSILMGTGEVQIHTQDAVVTAHISGGNKQISQMSSVPVLLDGKHSFDGVGVGLQYAWSCTLENDNSCFLDSMYRNGDWFHDQSNVTLQPASLRAGEMIFTLAVRSLSQAVTTASVFTSTRITCVSEQTTRVAIVASKDKVSPSKTMVIRSSGASTGHSWSVWPETTPSVSSNSSYLVVMPHSMAAGHAYRFTVQLHDSQAQSAAFAFVDVTCNSPPTGGSVTVTPNSGVFMHTVFRAIFREWRDEDLPLSYTMSLLRDGDTLTGHWSSSSVSFTMPVVGAVVVAADIYDSFGDAERVLQTVFVQPGAYNTSLAVEDLVVATATQDLARICQIIKALLGTNMRRRLAQTDPVYDHFLQALVSSTATAVFPQDVELLVQGVRNLLALSPGPDIVGGLFSLFANVTKISSEYPFDEAGTLAILQVLDEFADQAAIASGESNLAELRSLVLDVASGMLIGAEAEAPSESVETHSIALIVDRLDYQQESQMTATNFSMLANLAADSAGHDYVDIAVVGWDTHHFATQYQDLVSGIFSVYIMNQSHAQELTPPSVDVVIYIPFLDTAQLPSNSFAACRSLFSTTSWQTAVAGASSNATRSVACSTNDSFASVTVALVPQPWRVCNASEFEAEAPSWGNDRQCDTYTVCTPDQYEAIPPSNSTDRNCSQVSVCNHTTEMELVRPTLTSDRICICDDTHWNNNGVCTEYHNTCSELAYVVRNQTMVSDRHCACFEGYWGNGFVCSAWRVCDDHSFEIRPPNSTSDRVCSSRGSCSSLQFEISPPTATSDRVCEFLRNCSSNQYEANAATNIALLRLHDRECLNVTECTDAATELSPPTATSDRVCNCGSGSWYNGTSRSCHVWSECDPNAEEIAAPGFMADRSCRCRDSHYGGGLSCEPLTLCSDSEYENRSATLTSDRQCEAYTLCGMRMELVPATSTSDRSCACVRGDYLDSLSTCRPIRNCSSSQFEAMSPTLTSDRECEEIAVCTETEYEAAAPSQSSNRICIQISTCAAEARELVPPTNVSDRECSCGPEFYGDGTICHRLTECDALRGMVIAEPTLTTDRRCACPSFSIEMIDNHVQTCMCDADYPLATTDASGQPACRAYTACPQNALEIATPTPSADRQCECAEGFSGSMCLPISQSSGQVDAMDTGTSWWQILLGVLILLALAFCFFLLMRIQRRKASEQKDEPNAVEGSADVVPQGMIAVDSDSETGRLLKHNNGNGESALAVYSYAKQIAKQGGIAGNMPTTPAPYPLQTPPFLTQVRQNSGTSTGAAGNITAINASDVAISMSGLSIATTAMGRPPATPGMPVVAEGRPQAPRTGAGLSASSSFTAPSPSWNHPGGGSTPNASHRMNGSAHGAKQAPVMPPRDFSRLDGDASTTRLSVSNNSSLTSSKPPLMRATDSASLRPSADLPVITDPDSALDQTGANYTGSAHTTTGKVRNVINTVSAASTISSRTGASLGARKVAKRTSTLQQLKGGVGNMPLARAQAAAGAEWSYMTPQEKAALTKAYIDN